VLRDLEPLSTTPVAFGFAVLLGLLWGSFANVCIYRLPPTEEFPNGRSVATPASHCGVCKTPIKWYDNVPLFSWLWLRGQCRACKAKFSARYLIVEAATGLLFGVAWWMAMVPNALFEPFETRLIRFAISAAFCFVMIVVAFIDLDHRLILNKVTIPSMIVAYAASFALPGGHWYDGLIGAAIGYGLPWLIGEIYYRLRGVEGLGLGDGMLLAVVGALLGWPGVLVALFGGATVGTIIGIPALLLARRKGGPEPLAPAPESEASDAAGEAEGDLMRAELPFGVFLSIAAVFYLFAQPWISVSFRLPGA